MRTRILAFAAAGLTLAGCASTGVPGSDLTPEDRLGYVAMASASDLFEIQSSQLALDKAQKPEVRQFAQMLITHHTQTTATLTQAARASGLTPPPPTLTTMHREMMAALQEAPAGSFDQVYMRQQVPAHEMALTLHRNYASNGETPALRTAASSAVPIVEGHLAQARQLD